MSPKDFPKRVLLAVTGMSPQVVTETLFALVTERQFVPTEIRLITTANGRNRAVRDLLDEHDGQFHAFCREYDLVGQIHFDASCIAVISDSAGEPLPDIRTPEENSRAADDIARVVQDLCRDPEVALHVSIAGGRKSMGFFLGYALSLFARAQDRLSHVLVSDPFENNRDFFYPPKQPRELVLQDGRSVNAADARVMLAEIPLVRLRSGLPDELLQGHASYTGTVEAAQAGIDREISLRFDIESRQVYCGGVAVKLKPTELATMLWLAKLSLEGRASVRPGDDGTLEEYLGVYRQVVGDSLVYDNAAESLADSNDFLRRFQENCSTIAKKFKKKLGIALAEPYLIASFRVYTKTTYGLTLPAETICLIAD
jgi:CRISPR-associated protein (TIGR02584 family)